jgi:hypothetical protein
MRALQKTHRHIAADNHGLTQLAGQTDRIKPGFSA